MEILDLVQIHSISIIFILLIIADHFYSIFFHVINSLGKLVSYLSNANLIFQMVTIDNEQQFFFLFFLRYSIITLNKDFKFRTY